VRSRVTVPADATPEQVEAAALADEKVVAALAGGAPRKVIVVPGRLVNVVI
jgi:leucyl-tRNA synthetase